MAAAIRVHIQLEVVIAQMRELGRRISLRRIHGTAAVAMSNPIIHTIAGMSTVPEWRTGLADIATPAGAFEYGGRLPRGWAGDN